MANPCSLDIVITFHNKEQADAYFQDMEAKASTAWSINAGIELGCDKGLFDVDVQRWSDTLVCVQGWVKWMFHETDMYAMCTQLKDTPVSVLVRQSELGFNVHGSMEWDPEQRCLAVRWVPEAEVERLKSESDQSGASVDELLDEYLEGCPARIITEAELQQTNK